MGAQQPVRVTGATGAKSAAINGIYAPSDETVGGRCAYKNEHGRWMTFNSQNECWLGGQTSDEKGAYKGLLWGSGKAGHSPEQVTEWKVNVAKSGTTWEVQPVSVSVMTFNPKPFKVTGCSGSENAPAALANGLYSPTDEFIGGRPAYKNQQGRWMTFNAEKGCWMGGQVASQKGTFKGFLWGTGKAGGLPEEVTEWKVHVSGPAEAATWRVQPVSVEVCKISFSDESSVPPVLEELRVKSSSVMALREHLKSAGVALPFSFFKADWDKFYTTLSDPKANTSRWKTAWNGGLNGTTTSLYPYMCPVGWRRFALNVPERHSEFHTFQDTYLMYHGLHPENVQKIIRNGFIAKECQHGCPAVYLTPSILYAAHPRYARVVKIGKIYCQVVLEVRMRKSLWKKEQVQGETLCAGDIKIDPNFPDNETVEFLVKGEAGEFVKPNAGLVVTGIMMRCLDTDPALMACSNWWLEWPKNRKRNDKHKNLQPADVEEMVSAKDALEWLQSKCYC
mmetsp:Transcript_7102/g.13152  ORF Transcript_7102/g.13152 Transcript_7102/m.13152 type:complete len:506 (-) Transcript_7102:79-1596(-)